MSVITVARTTLITIDENVPLNTNYESDIIDFREMDTAFIQVVQTLAPDVYTGQFNIKVSLICDPTTFVPYPDSERLLNASCNNFAWTMCKPFRYAIICYTANNVTTGTVDIYARAKLT